MEFAFRGKFLHKGMNTEFYHHFCVQELHRKRHGARHDKLLCEFTIFRKVFYDGAF